METKIPTVNVDYFLDLYYGCHIDKELLLIDNIKDLAVPEGPVRMQCLGILLIQKGNITYMSNTQKLNAKANNFVVFSRGQIIDEIKISNDCEGKALMISYDYFRDMLTGFRELALLFINITIRPILQLTKTQASEFAMYYSQLKKKVDDSKHHFRKELVGSMIKTIIYDVSNIIYLAQEGKQIVSKNRAEHIFGDFIEIVSHNYMKERTVSWYAEQMNITPKYLAEMVKQATNRSPNDWIDGYVIVEIRMLLKYTGKSIKEIAEIMHFTSQSFLGKYFKEHVGVSPKDYRKS